jgi:hypothetical protein
MWISSGQMQVRHVRGELPNRRSGARAMSRINLPSSGSYVPRLSYRRHTTRIMRLSNKQKSAQIPWHLGLANVRARSLGRAE